MAIPLQNSSIFLLISYGASKNSNRLFTHKSPQQKSSCEEIELTGNFSPLRKHKEESYIDENKNFFASANFFFTQFRCHET
jgi:hypothetical protein